MSDASKSLDSNSTSTTLKETRIDNRIERSNSLTSKKLHKLSLHRQDSIYQTPNITDNTNQDVSSSIFLKSVKNTTPNTTDVKISFLIIRFSAS